MTPNPIPIPDKLAIGEKLQQVRKRRGLSQVELAKRLGIHQSLISQYERGYLRLHGALIVRLAAALEVTPDTLLASALGKDTPPEAPVDRRFLRRLQKIDKLSSHEKKILLCTIDAFLAKVS